MQIFSKNIPFYIAIVALVATTFVACTKPNALGADLIEGDNVYGELVVSNDTTSASADFRMNTTTEAEDSVLVHYVSLGAHQSRFLLGAINDPVFGKTTANMYLQPYSSGTLVDADMVVDSSVLILQYDMPSNNGVVVTNATTLNAYKSSNVIGDTLQPQSITIQTIADSTIDINKSYFSDKDFAINTNLLNLNYTFTPTPTTFKPLVYRNNANTADSIVKNNRLLPHIRIKLPSNFTNAIYQKAILEANSKLRAALPGLVIKTSPSNTAMLRFNVLESRLLSESSPSELPTNVDSYTRILFYGHKAAKPTEKTFYTISFKGFSDGVVFNKFKHERPIGSAIDKALKTKNTGDSVIYVQGMAGTNGRISFPNLGKLKGKVIINKAEIVFKAISDNTNLPKPEYLQLTRKMLKANNSENISIFESIRDVYLARYAYTSEVIFTSFDGKLNGSTYTMDITYEMQDLIDNKNATTDKDIQKDPKRAQERNLYIALLGKIQRAQRVALGGARNKTYAPVLKVYMTRI